MKQEMICIVCPLSCRLQIEQDEAKNIMAITGNKCKRGEVYAHKELTNPTRLLTSTVIIHHALHQRLPIMTSSDIPKDRMFDVMKAIAHIEVEAPVQINQVILSNVCDLNVDIIASRTMHRLSKE
jgi:CxxC motif-containing protein